MTVFTWHNYERPYALPRACDFATYSNEDIGLTATIEAAGTDQSNYNYALPYPSSYDLYEETMQLYRADHMLIDNVGEIAPTEAQYILDIYTSMLQIEAEVDWDGVLDDTHDEVHKSYFAGPMTIGMDYNLFATNASTPSIGFRRTNRCINQYMPYTGGIRSLSPIYYVLQNRSAAYAADMEATGANFTKFETVSQRIWHAKSKLTKREQDFMNQALKFQIIDT